MHVCVCMRVYMRMSVTPHFKGSKLKCIMHLKKTTHTNPTTHTDVHTDPRTHTHALTQNTHSCAYTEHAHSHLHSLVYRHKHTHTQTHTRTRTHIYTRTNMHTHMHSHTQVSPSLPSGRALLALSSSNPHASHNLTSPGHHGTAVHAVHAAHAASAHRLPHPVFAAVQGGSLAVLDALIRAGARVDVRDSKCVRACVEGVWGWG